jgi:hypothetical protein
MMLLHQRYNLTAKYVLLYSTKNKQHNTRELIELPHNFINKSICLIHKICTHKVYQICATDDTKYRQNSTLTIVHIKSKHMETNTKIRLVFPESSIKLQEDGLETIKTGERIFAHILNSYIMICVKMTS